MKDVKTRCAVWGTNHAGQQTAKIAAYLGYEVVVYCRSIMPKDKTQICGVPIAEPWKLKQLYNKKKIDCIIIGIKNPVSLREVEKTIDRAFPKNIPLLYPDELENKYLQRIKELINYKWTVDFRNQAAIWVQNFMSEVDFWVKEVAKDGGIYHESYFSSLNNTDFYGIFKADDGIAQALETNAVVMDISCGLVPKYGNRLPDGREIEVLAVDPLAHFYNKINEKYAGMEYKTSKFGLFEFIANYIEKDYCSLILINNALDHCIDPYKSLIECLYVLKKSGKMRLSHRRAEALYEAYDGLHKWNIDFDQNNNFIIWNPDHGINITERLKEICEIQVEYTGDALPRIDQWITVYITKIKDFQLDQFIDMGKEQSDLAFFVEKLMERIAGFTETYLT